MADTPFIESQLLGFFDPAFVPTRQVLLTLEQDPEEMLTAAETPMTRIHDARHVQRNAARQDCASEAEFFETRGFVLIGHTSAVTDWDVDPALPEPDNELMHVYRPEIESLVRTQLLPHRRFEMWLAPHVRRFILRPLS